jgi:hypothetical protein
MRELRGGRGSSLRESAFHRLMSGGGVSRGGEGGGGGGGGAGRGRRVEEVCRFFSQGRCRDGANCNFLHVPPQVIKA